MTSSAISAQGSTLSIQTSVAPAPVNVSSVTVSTSATTNTTTVNTATPHGLPNGAVVQLSGLTGTGASLLNGIPLVAKVTGASSFTVPVNTFSLTVTATSATVTGASYVPVKNFRSFNGLDGQASEIDVTNLASKAKEIRLGLVDFGQFSVELDHDLTDPGQQQVQVAYLAGSASYFLVTLPNGDTASYTAYVRKFSLQGGVDAVVKRQVDQRITGPVTWC